MRLIQKAVAITVVLSVTFCFLALPTAKADDDYRIYVLGRELNPGGTLFLADSRGTVYYDPNGRDITLDGVTLKNDITLYENADTGIYLPNPCKSANGYNLILKGDNVIEIAPKLSNGKVVCAGINALNDSIQITDSGKLTVTALRDFNTSEAFDSVSNVAISTSKSLFIDCAELSATAKGLWKMLPAISSSKLFVAALKCGEDLYVSPNNKNLSVQTTAGNMDNVYCVTVGGSFTNASNHLTAFRKSHQGGVYATSHIVKIAGSFYKTGAGSMTIDAHDLELAAEESVGLYAGGEIKVQAGKLSCIAGHVMVNNSLPKNNWGSSVGLLGEKGMEISGQAEVTATGGFIRGNPAATTNKVYGESTGLRVKDRVTLRDHARLTAIGNIAKQPTPDGDYGLYIISITSTGAATKFVSASGSAKASFLSIADPALNSCIGLTGVDGQTLRLSAAGGSVLRAYGGTYGILDQTEPTIQDGAFTGNENYDLWDRMEPASFFNLGDFWISVIAKWQGYVPARSVQLKGPGISAAAASVPSTGDSANPVLWISLMALCLGLIGAAAMNGRRRGLR